jgi:hypothetical protein
MLKRICFKGTAVSFREPDFGFAGEEASFLGVATLSDFLEGALSSFLGVALASFEAGACSSFF